MFDQRTKFQDSLFYDVSAWTFPFAFNVSHDELSSLSQAGAQVTDLKAPNGIVYGSGI
jgi:hypothetical protein